MTRSTQSTLALCLVALAGAPALGGELLVGGDQGIVRVLDTETGVTSFLGTCSGPINAMAIVGDELFLGDQNGFVYAFDTQTNFVTNAFSVPVDASAMVSVGGELLIGDSGGAGEVVRVDPADGSVLETMSGLGTDVQAIGVDAGGLFLGGHSSIAKRSHIGSSHFLFFAACGSMINSMAFGPDTMFLGGIHFFGELEGTVYLFDKFVGGVGYSGTYDVDSDVTAMVYMEGMLYIAGSDGIVHEMNPSDGSIVNSFDTGSPIQAMIPRDGGASCPADYDISGGLDFFDISTFLDIFTARLPAGDTNGDGAFDFFDIDTFLDIYDAGCP
jgi:outer membrane protein assembly factor BamB